MDLDKYARNALAWRQTGDINYAAAIYLFQSRNPFFLFPAAVQGHLALETYLKALLIAEGMTAFNPNGLKKLNPNIGLKAADCVWDHKLGALAKTLAAKRRDFRLTDELWAACIVEPMPMQVRKAFERVDPFFKEIRYPIEATVMGEIGEEHGSLLTALAGYLQPFLDKIK
jgi:hypothetical protein